MHNALEELIDNKHHSQQDQEEDYSDVLEEQVLFHSIMSFLDLI